MLRGDRAGGFEDVTIETRLLDVQDVDYSILDPADSRFDSEKQRISSAFHENGKGLAKGDLNGDGYVDMIATNSSGDLYDDGGNVVFTKGPLFVWMNQGSGKNWIALRLKGRMAIDGTGGNADAVGARIYLTAKTDKTSAAAPTTQVQEALASSTFLSMNSADLHFGLGDAETVDEITIRWPGGATQTLHNVPANQVLVVEETGAISYPIAFPLPTPFRRTPESSTPRRYQSYFLQPSVNLCRRGDIGCLANLRTGG